MKSSYFPLISDPILPFPQGLDRLPMFQPYEVDSDDPPPKYLCIRFA